MRYHVYFRRPNDCVVYAPVTEHHEVSLVHRGHDGSWHCALCDATDCRHASAASRAGDDAAGDGLAGTAGDLGTDPLPDE